MVWMLGIFILYGLTSLAAGMVLATLSVRNSWGDIVSLMNSSEARFKTHPRRHKAVSSVLGYLLARFLILYVWLSGSAYFTFQWPFYLYGKLKGRA